MSLKNVEVDFYCNFIASNLSDVVGSKTLKISTSSLSDGKMFGSLVRKLFPSEFDQLSSKIPKVRIGDDAFFLTEFIRSYISPSFSTPDLAESKDVIEICWLLVRKFYLDKVRLSSHPLFISHLLTEFDFKDFLKMNAIQHLFLWNKWILQRSGESQLSYSDVRLFTLDYSKNIQIIKSIASFLSLDLASLLDTSDSSEKLGSPRIFFVLLCRMYEKDAETFCNVEKLSNLYEISHRQMLELESNLNNIACKVPSQEYIDDLIKNRVAEVEVKFEKEKQRLEEDFYLFKEDYKSQIYDLISSEKASQIRALEESVAEQKKQASGVRDNLIYSISLLRNSLEYCQNDLAALLKKLSSLNQDSGNEKVSEIVLGFIEVLVQRHGSLRNAPK